MKLQEQSEQFDTKLREHGEQLDAKLNKHAEKQSEQFQEAVRQLSEYHKVHSIISESVDTMIVHVGATNPGSV